jgi:DNA gyrase subunit B
MSDEHVPPETVENLATTATEEYTPEDVNVLRDAAHIRERPEMYIGSRGPKGFHHLVYELVANSVDEALAGFCKNVHVSIKPDGSVSVVDDGRGIPVEEHPQEKVSTLQVVMTVVGAGAKFRKGSYKVSAGLHGMGAKAVTALSEWSEAIVYRGGRTYRQEYELGRPIGPVEDIGASKQTGTRVTFKPDPVIFGDLVFDYETLEERLRELAYLNRGLTIVLLDERTKQEATFKFDRGIVEFVEHINRRDDPLHPPIVLEKTQDDVKLEVAMQYISGEESRIRCYGNNAYNYEGGTHQSGFFAALSRAIGTYGDKQELFKKIKPEGKDYREGLSVVLSAQVPDPKFDSQEKRKLTNVEVEGIVTSIVYETLTKWLEEHPKEAQRICKKVETAAEAREAAAKARKALKDRKGLLSGGGLPGKLYDCSTRDRDESELFLVEGDSAGGSAVGGRDSKYQAILPLRGKLINVEKARLEAMLDNREITSLISAIGIDIADGAGIDEEENLKRLRYNKIVILTDADVDGQHIRTLLLTFFYRQMGSLVARGHIYVARPPLYKVTAGKGAKQEVEFIATAEAMDKKLNERGLKNARFRILPLESEGGAERRLEGQELADLLKLTAQIETSLGHLERSGVNLSVLIGKAGPRGLPAYRVTMATHDEWFFSAEEQAAFLKEQEKAGYTVASEERTTTAATSNGTTPTNGSARLMYLQDFREVGKVINKILPELEKFGLLPRDLLPLPRVAGREPPPHLILETDAAAAPRQLANLRDLVAEIRKLGERGLSVTRFKGLGEMDPDELWETTLDPAKRTLLQVQLDDVLKADEMFRTLMGDKVEPRREFIVENAVKAKDLDMHGA